MSLHRLGNQKSIGAGALQSTRQPPRRVILNLLDDLLWEMGRHAGVGDEVMWETLRLTVEPGQRPTEVLQLRATVEVSRDDLVAGFSAVALAEHERGKSARQDS